jgi:hypothetical protein
MDERPIPVIPPPAFTIRFLCGVAVAFAAFIVYLYFRSTAGMPPERAHQQIPGMLGMIGFDVLFVGIVVWAVQRRSLTLTPVTLSIRAGFYSRTIPLESLRVHDGLITSLFEHRELAPRWRTNGIRVPGFQAGWYRLAKAEKSFVLLTDPRVVTYLPTSEGFSLLVSTTELLTALNGPESDAFRPGPSACD